MNYVICSSQRSGSSLLCHLLRQTRAAGKPGEFMTDTKVQNYSDASPEENGRALLDENRTPNGVSGIKIHFHQLENLEKVVPLSKIANFEKFIIMDRSNDIAQAVSLAKAWQTKEWSSKHEGVGEPSYDASEIDRAIERLKSDAEGWKSWLATHDKEAVTVTYESLTEDATGEIARLCDYLGIDGRAVDMDRVGIKKQADEVNERWEARFREERGL